MLPSVSERLPWPQVPRNAPDANASKFSLATLAVTVPQPSGDRAEVGARLQSF
jgi:hypothetical protein